MHLFRRKTKRYYLLGDHDKAGTILCKMGVDIPNECLPAKVGGLIAKEQRTLQDSGCKTAPDVTCGSALQPIFRAFPGRLAISLPIGRLVFSIMEICRGKIPIISDNYRWAIDSLFREPCNPAPGRLPAPGARHDADKDGKSIPTG